MLTERQTTVIQALHANGSGQSAAEVAEVTGLGDSRGVAQTIRRMPEYVEKGAAGYRLTRKGHAAARKLAE